MTCSDHFLSAMFSNMFIKWLTPSHNLEMEKIRFTDRSLNYSLKFGALSWNTFTRQICPSVFFTFFLFFYSLYIYIRVCVCVCVYIYIYIYTHTHTHTLVWGPSLTIIKYDFCLNKLLNSY